MESCCSILIPPHRVLSGEIGLSYCRSQGRGRICSCPRTSWNRLVFFCRFSTFVIAGTPQWEREVENTQQWDVSIHFMDSFRLDAPSPVPFFPSLLLSEVENLR